MSQSVNETTYERVKASFGPNAQQYSASTGHADADVLQQLVAKVGPKSSDKVLDIGTGAGHTAIAFAPAVASVVRSFESSSTLCNDAASDEVLSGSVSNPPPVDSMSSGKAA